MPQTKFVLKKAIEAGHKIILVINKIDKNAARPDWVLNHTFDLFVDLGASEEQANFPVIYASAINGKAGPKADLASMTDISPLLDAVIEHIPLPVGEASAPLQVGVVNVQYDNYKGRSAIGRVVNGVIKPNQQVMHINRQGVMKPAKVTAVQVFDGLGKRDVEGAEAGEVVVLSGIETVEIGETIADATNPIALPVMQIELPTVKMTFSVNTSPFAGKEGEFSTARNLKERLERELQNDVALKMEEGVGEGTFIISGRGELHLAILIEKMRREGYEFQVSRPKVIFRQDNGVTEEPFEAVSIECPEVNGGVVIEKMGRRRGEMKDMRVENGITYMEFEIPTRGLIGYRSEFLTDTKGQGILNTLLLGYRPEIGEISTNPHGSLISMESGTTMGYALTNLQERGDLFVGPGVEVYAGMVIGQTAKAEDMEVNPCKEKKLSNMRSKGDGASVAIVVPRVMTLETSLEYLGEDELLEVTPKSLRIRKVHLDANVRKKAG